MTKLSPGKSVTRETQSQERGEAIIVTLHPKYLEVRLKGRRQGVTVDYESLLDIARKIAYRRSGGKL